MNSNGRSLLDSDLDGILSAIPASSVDYDGWLHVGMALKAEGFGCDIWDAWSANDPTRYHAGECERKWRGFGDGGDGRRNGGTIVKMAMDNGYRPPDDFGKAVGWDVSEAYAEENCTCSSHAPATEHSQKNVVVDTTWLEEEELHEPDDAHWHPAEQLLGYMEALFSPDDIVGYVTDTFQRPDGKHVPSGLGDFTRTAGSIEQQLRKYGDDLSYTIGQTDPEAGAWIRFNPLDGHGVRNDNVADFRYALVESDTMKPKRQMAIMKALQLPIAAAVFSGGKSLHAIVHIDAHDYDEYRKRVDFLYQTCRDNGIEIDAQNKNPSRLSRMPGVMRSGKKQWLVSGPAGLPSWNAWSEWLAEQNDDLPEPETLDQTWDDMPELAPPLIDGVLRQGHKMLLAGPSKAGKSFALIALTIAIAEGGSWFGWKCAQGRVMYVNLELDRASCLHRFRDVYRAMGLAAEHREDIAIWNLRGHSKPMDKLAPALIRRAAKIRPIAVIIDPIYKVITGDENAADQMAAFCNQFDKVADSLGCAVIYCHHHSKGSQGQKRSMDRASGSGVFARDPDALIDMLELHIDDAMRSKLEEMAVSRQSIRFMDSEAAGRIGTQWRQLVRSEDMQAGGDALMAACRTLLEQRAQDLVKPFLDSIVSAREAAHRATAWRIDGTLREFPRFDPVNLVFDYPMHMRDPTGMLADASPEGEVIERNAYRAQGRERKAKNDSKRHDEINAAISSAVQECSEDGVEPTQENVASRMPDIAGSPVTKSRLKNWTKDSCGWCDWKTRKGSGRESVLYSAALEDALSGFYADEVSE